MLFLNIHKRSVMNAHMSDGYETDQLIIYIHFSQVVHANLPAAGQRSQLSASRAPQAESSAAGVWFCKARQTKLGVCCGFHIKLVPLPIFTHVESTDLV